MKISAKFIVSGIVQGVGFRYFVYRHASALGLKGYARNLWDGSVEVFVEGEESVISELHQHLKQGPRHSSVDSVKVERGEFKGKYDYFEIH